MTLQRTLALFNYDWDRIGFWRQSGARPVDSAGFDLFSFPSNARLAGFDLERSRVAWRGRPPPGLERRDLEPQ